MASQCSISMLVIAFISCFVTGASLEERAIDPQFSPFARCMRGKINNYPYGAMPVPAQVLSCLSEVRAPDSKITLGRRDPMDVKLGLRDASESGDLVEQVFVAGRNLSIAQEPICDGDEVNNNFLWVTEIRDNAVGVCKELIGQINSNGIDQDGGVGLVVRQFKSGHNKRGHQLRDNTAVTASFLLNFVPPAKSTVDTIREIASGIDQLCSHAITKIATKEIGCTADLNFYRPSKARSYTGTGSIGGILKIISNRFGEDHLAAIAMNFSNDE